MTFEGEQYFGRAKIMQKFLALTFQKIGHLITATDVQPMFDGGIMVVVLGQLKVVPKSRRYFVPFHVLCKLALSKRRLCFFSDRR